MELDEQAGAPGEHDGLRVTGNLVAPTGELAEQSLVRSVGIGTRVQVLMTDIGGGMALPSGWWTTAPNNPPGRAPTPRSERG